MIVSYRLMRKFILQPKQFIIDAFHNRQRLKVAPLDTIFAFNFKEWKKPYLESFFPSKKIVYLPINLNKNILKKKFIPFIINNDIEVLCWGLNIPQAIKESGIKVKYVEDGFIRSAGLGSQHTPPMSLNFDSHTVYFDARQPSDLEIILSTYDFKSDVALMERARNLRALIINSGVSKYNHTVEVDIDRIYGEKSKKRILVIGQVEDDASIKYGCIKSYTNNDLIKMAVRENPNAQVIYKPHPDVLLKKRKEVSDPMEVASICKIITEDIPLAQSLQSIDHVYTITSQSGFEALLRDIPVTTLGCPFYAGWGGVDNRQPNSRRTAKLDVDEILAAAYILYPRYYDFEQGREVEVEDVINILTREKSSSIY